MSTLLSGKLAAAAHEMNIWRPSEGKYLARLKLTTLRNYLHALFPAEVQNTPVSLEQGAIVLRSIWQNARLERQPGRSHAYRHLFTLQLLGLIVPHGKRDGYTLAPRGAELLRLGTHGASLSSIEHRFFADAMISPFTDAQSPLLAFARLFAPGVHTAQQFRCHGQPVTLCQTAIDKLQIKTATKMETITGREAVEHVIHGCRDLFLQAELIGDIPLADNAPARAHRLLFPVQTIDPIRLEDVIEDVVARIRDKMSTSVRLSISSLSMEIRPQLKLSSDDYEHILQAVSQRCAGELYFDRLSSIQIAGREDAYIRIGGYWRASIVRY